MLTENNLKDFTDAMSKAEDAFDECQEINEDVNSCLITLVESLRDLHPAVAKDVFSYINNVYEMPDWWRELVEIEVTNVNPRIHRLLTFRNRFRIVFKRTLCFSHHNLENAIFTLNNLY